MQRHFDVELDELKEKVSAMGRTVEEQLEGAIGSLLNRDADKAREIIARDHQVNAMEVAIDEECIRLIALYQPEARDLRFIITAMKIITDLERMSDLASNVCERVIELKEELPYPIPPAIPQMGEIAREMLLSALTAFITRDTKLALDVCRRDEEVNVIHRELIRSIVTGLAHDPDRVSPAVRILFMSRSLERFADHVTNVAEIIVYLVEGKVIRHLV